MIIKSFELNKVDYNKKLFLLYGENQGYKNQIIEEKIADVLFVPNLCGKID